MRRAHGKTITQHDLDELRRFETYLRATAAVKRGEAINAPELLYAAVYGQDGESKEDGGHDVE